MTYSEQVLDHFHQPRNVGSLPTADPNVGTAMVEAVDCGDVIRLQIAVDSTGGRIGEARFKAFGCGSAIASASFVTEWLRGKTLDDALNIGCTEVATALALPPEKLHCAQLAADAAAAAVADYHRKQSEAPTPCVSPADKEEA